MIFHLSDQSNLSESNRVQSWLNDIYGSLDYHQNSTQKSELIKMNLKKKTKLKIIRQNKHAKIRRHFFRNYSKRNLIVTKNNFLLKSNLNKNNFQNESDLTLDSNSYFSQNGLSDDSNIFSDFSPFDYCNEKSIENNNKQTKIKKRSRSKLKTQKQIYQQNSCLISPDIKAEDLEFGSLSSITSNYGGSYSKNKNSFGMLECWNNENNLFSDDINNLEFRVKCYAFEPKHIKIRIRKNVLVVTGKQQTEEDNGFYKREFKKKFYLPHNCDKKGITYIFSSNDILTIKVPRIHSVP